MNSRTQELTFGAMLIAVFGVILVLNRQTGGLFEELIFFILPIPMTIFSMKYDWKDSLSVFVCMALLSFFLGTLYTAFYAVTEAFLGVILGICLRRHHDLNRTQLLIMGLSALFSVVGSVVLASVFGIDVNTELTEMQNMMTNMFNNAGLSVPANNGAISDMLSMTSLKRMYILSMALIGLMQGFIIVRLSLLILKRLRLHVPQAQPVGLYYPPKWSGILALFLFLLYTWSIMHPLGNEPVQNIVQTAGLCSYIYLLCFGWIAMTMLINKFISGGAGRMLSALLAAVLLFVMPYLFQILGFAYICTRFHDYLLGM